MFQAAIPDGERARREDPAQLITRTRGLDWRGEEGTSSLHLGSQKTSLSSATDAGRPELLAI
jgi:hypothetical protein